MAAPAYTADDFTTALQNLLPTGRAWPRDPDANLTKVLRGLAGSFAASAERAAQLLIEAFPATTSELLAEWEASLGLPDPCAGDTPTVQTRRAQVLARFAGGGGASAAFIEAYALALGYVVTVDVVDNVTFSVTSDANTVTWFRAGQSSAGDPLANWGNDVLECEIEAIKPAHLAVQFIYV